MKKSVAVIGKGPSIRRCSSSYFDKYDDVIICNVPCYKGYTENIPYRANIQFRNNMQPSFTKEEISNLGLHEVYSTSSDFEKIMSPEYECYSNLILFHQKNYMSKYMKWNTEIKSHPSATGSYVIDFDNLYFENPSTGIIAITWAVTSGRYNNIYLAGFDFFEVGKPAYYFKSDEWINNHKYLLDGSHYSSDGITMKENPHGSSKLIQYICDLISNFNDITFTFTTDSKILKECCKTLNNVKFLDTI